MANRTFLVVNPNDANVVQNGKTAIANEITQLTFDDAALVGGWNDVLVFLTNGCMLADNLAPTQKLQEAAGDVRHGQIPGR
jgi:hypothetical protein